MLIKIFTEDQCLELRFKPKASHVWQRTQAASCKQCRKRKERLALRSGTADDWSNRTVVHDWIWRLRYDDAVTLSQKCDMLMWVQWTTQCGTSGCGPLDHVSQVLQELNWLPIDKRIDYKLCLLVHKASIGQTPTYIASLARGLSRSPHLKLGTSCRPIWKRQPVPLAVWNAL